ncbi:baseplate J/gp47 family protein [Kutzneria kofuensis]|uniref:Putative phage protein gp47/JayE n=1 Tax=Kutzneria kofuensis TaxID=103725 RepID=A0A7W9KNY7_9PSEU|nr:baseplate J/gp47 family protein [Kutzneria kofuensis]MBB5896054.1 putative phage protein gp47/JayE [Kutzneria kofuensis]
MTDFGVTADGFVLKGFAEILQEAQQRARDAFGPDVDLSATSALNKILQVTADEDALLWQRLEDTYYSQFVSTATGPSLDQLGEDIGLPRGFLFAHGQVQFTIDNPDPGRTYLLPVGIILTTNETVPVAFRTTEPARLSAQAKTVTVAARAFEPGESGDVDTGEISLIDFDYQDQYLNLGPNTRVTVTNPAPFTGGDARESDTDYRARQLGYPREMWTVQSVRAAVLSVPGVLDVLLSDPLGGPDVSQSYFTLFDFNQRVFAAERRVDQQYDFTVVVAHEIGRPWHTTGVVIGVYDRVLAAVDRVRPMGIHPNIVPADHIEVGLRARVVIEPGIDKQAITAALVRRLANDIGGLRLGDDVLFSQIMAVLVDQPGVLDVQDMRLRRFPPQLGRVVFGAVEFQRDVFEAAVGENLGLGPTEIAVFRLDSGLLDLEVVGR